MSNPSLRDDRSFVDTIKSLISQRRSEAADSETEDTPAPEATPEEQATRSPADPETGTETEFEWASRGTSGGYHDRYGTTDSDIDTDPDMDEAANAAAVEVSSDNIVNMRGFGRFSALDDGDANTGDAPSKPPYTPIFARPVPDPADVTRDETEAEAKPDPLEDPATGVLLSRDDEEDDDAIADSVIASLATDDALAPEDTETPDDQEAAEELATSAEYPVDDFDAPTDDTEDTDTVEDAPDMVDTAADTVTDEPEADVDQDADADNAVLTLADAQEAEEETLDDLSPESVSLGDPDPELADDATDAAPTDDDPEPQGSPLLLAPTDRIAETTLETKASHVDAEPLVRGATDDHVRARVTDLIREELGPIIDARIEARLREVLGDDLARISPNNRSEKA